MWIISATKYAQSIHKNPQSFYCYLLPWIHLVFMFKRIIVVVSMILLMDSIAIAAGNYVELTSLGTGTDPTLSLTLHQKSFDLDLLKTSNMRARLKVKNLYRTIDSTASFRIDLYDVTGGGNEFISSQSLSLLRGAHKNRVLSISAGHFTAATKDLRFDVYDTQGNLANSFTATVNATNLVSQASSGTGSDVTCAGSVSGSDSLFGECQLDAFFQRVDFVARRQKQASTRVVKGENGRYTVSVPVPRKPFNYLRGNRVRGVITATDSGGTTSNFGDTIDASVLRLGGTALNNTALSYNTTSNQLEVGFSGSTSPVITAAQNGDVTITGSVTADKFIGPTPVAVSATAIDINGQTSIDATDLNFITITDSNTGTTDTLTTITGGVVGQKLQLQLLADMKFHLNNVATANTIQWGRGTIAGTDRTQFNTEIFEFVNDGNAWYLLSRYTLSN